MEIETDKVVDIIEPDKKQEEVKKEAEVKAVVEPDWKAEAEKAQSLLSELNKKLAEQAEGFKREKGDWAVKMDLFNLGITDQDAIDVAKLYHDKLPKENKPSLVDWLKEMKADPSKVVKGLKPFLEMEKKAEQQQPSANKLPIPPKANAGEPAAMQEVTTVVTAAALRQAYAEAKKTNDWSKYDELRKHA